jgi:hypothetical protein
MLPRESIEAGRQGPAATELHGPCRRSRLLEVYLQTRHFGGYSPQPRLATGAGVHA